MISQRSNPLKSSTLALTFSIFLVSIDTQAIDSNSILINKVRQCLHAIETQATDPFDKATYLDLNTEYTQTVVNKKDSKTTTFLKEVGGTLRTALGSTDSDNAGELGNKISSGLKTQALNKAEGLMNDKTNQFFNQFGSGRSEVSIHGSNFNFRAFDYIQH